MEKLELYKATGNLPTIESPTAPGVKPPNSDAFLNLLEKAGKAVAEPQAAAAKPVTISPIIWRGGYMRRCL